MQHEIAYETTGRRLRARDRQTGRNPRRPLNVLQRAGLDCMRRAVALEAEIATLAGSLRQHKARLLSLVSEYDALGGWIASGATSCAHWLADLLDIELSTAREQVRVARTLRELPATAAAVEAGVLSYAKARAITRVARAETERELLDVAHNAPAGALARRLANWQTVHEPHRLSEQQWAGRACTYRQEADGSVTVSLRLPPEVAARVRAALDAEAMRPPSGGESGPAPTTLVQRRADVAAERLCTRAPAGASSPTRSVAGPRPVEIVVHRRLEHAEVDGVVLAPATAARLGCDAAVRVMTHHGDGSPADVGRRHRLVTARLRRLVTERDRHCTHPGCTSADFLEVHHVIPWEQGGPTDLANLSLLCGFHHRRRHDAQAAPTDALS